MYIIYSADMFLLNLENPPTQKNSTRILGVLFIYYYRHTHTRENLFSYSYRAYQYTSSIDASA